MRQHLYRYLMVTLGCVLMGIAINAFYMPNKLISGGIGGVSVIISLVCQWALPVCF